MGLWDITFFGMGYYYGSESSRISVHKINQVMEVGSESWSSLFIVSTSGVKVDYVYSLTASLPLKMDGWKTFAFPSG